MAPHAARMTGWSSRLATAVLTALLAAGLPAPCPAQAPGADVKYTNQTRFWIPFEPEGAVQRLREVHLYYSSDQGRTWHRMATAPPNQRGFQFQGGRDGVYWFTVQTVDIESRAYPASIEGAQPQLVVCIDTRPPAVRLAPLAPQDGAGVEWDIQDEHLDLSTLKLEWRGPGSPAWQAMPPPVEAAAAGRRAWQAGVAVDEVRLQVRDRAGNLGEGHTSFSGRRSDNRTYPAEPGSGGANRPPIRLVNSNRISINYKVEDVGPSKATLELWWTKNQGRTWEKCQDNLGTQGPVVVSAQEGLYGFTLVARSGVNLGDRPPQAGDPPQIWVEVDLTPPKVQLSPPEVGRGLDANKMALRWAATDKNLEERPVKLEYAPVTQENATEPPPDAWEEIVANLSPDGQYVWIVPPGGVRYFVRAVVKDRAGNTGAARTPRPVVVDLSRPRGIITDVEPARGEGGASPQNSIQMPPRGGPNSP